MKVDYEGTHRAFSLICLAISIPVRTKDPRAKDPNDGPNAFLSVPTVVPLKSTVPGGAKYHCAVTPATVYMRTSKASMMVHSAKSPVKKKHDVITIAHTEIKINLSVSLTN